MDSATDNAGNGSAQAGAAESRPQGRLAVAGRGLGFALACAAGAGALALAAAAVAGPFARDALHAAAGALLLGASLAYRPPAWAAVLAGVLAAAAFAGAGSLWQRGWQMPAMVGAAIVLGSLLACAVLRRRRIDPRASGDPGELLAALVAAVVFIPLAALLPDLVPAAGVGGPPAWPSLQALAAHWLAATFALIAVLPVWLTARSDADTPRGLWPALVVLVIAAAGLFHWPGWWGVLGLPLLACALRCGARATALLGLLAAAVLLGVAGHDWSGRAELLPMDFPLAASAAAVAVAIASSVPLALLASHRERAEVASRTSSDRLQVLLQAVPALVAGFGPDLRHRFANRHYLQWHGRSEAAVLGRSVHEVFGERAAAAMATTVQRALAGQSQRLQLRLADGRELEAHYLPQFGADGAIDGFQLLARDLSWRQQGERQQRALLDALADAAAVLTPAGEVVEVNTQFESLFGAGRGELVGRAFSERLAEDTRKRHPALVEEAARLAQGQRFEGAAGLRARRADGSEFPVELSFTPMPVEGGARLLLVAHEHGGRAPAAPVADTRVADGAAAGTDGQAQATLDAIADALVVCDARQRITGFNPMAATLTGWSRREAIGRGLDEVLALIDPTSGQATPSVLHEAVRSGQPVRVRDDRMLVRRDGSQCPVEESASPMHDTFGMVAGGVLLLRDATEARAASENISHLAQHDFLTNLPNRVLLQDRLQQALARVPRGDKGALLYLDLDKFKPINDTLGHPVGDKVLQEIAKRLVACVRDDDTVSRQGGDEFVLLLVRLADPRDVARVAEKLITAIEQPIRVDGQDLSVGASIGIALFPQDGRDARTLMKQADTALYHAKETGRGRYCYFTDAMSESAEARMRTEHDLRFALANEDFFLVYQPRVQLPERRIAGIEALVRWRRPEGVSVPLEEFIPVAEETGLVVQIDEWVLRQACRQARLWQDQGLPALPVSINVSLSRFDADRLLGQVQAALAESALAPELLEIEFRESPLFAQGERGLALVAALKALGVRVAVDDFGSGASGVGALAGYRFDTLKIDRAFVAALPGDADKAAIIEAIVGLGRALRIAVVAKGIETHAQEELLLRQGCRQMQGFLYSTPLEAERFAGLHSGGEAAPALRRA